MGNKTRFLILICALIGLSAWSAFSLADKSPNAGAAIRQVLTQQQSAWNRGDVKEFLNGYWRSPDLTFSGSNGTTRGWDNVLARYQMNYPNSAAMGKLEFSELEFRYLGENHALVLGKWHLTREKDGLGGVFTLVWQKFPEGWRIIHDHTSLAAPKP